MTVELQSTGIYPDFEEPTGSKVKVIKKKKVAIIGTASSSVNNAPYGDTDFEIWGLAWRVLPRVTRMFDLHPLVGRKNVPADYIDLLAEYDKPIYLQKKHPKIPTSITYPLDEVVTYLGPDNFGKTARGDYFASSFGYMMALALYEGYEEIHSYGFDMLEDSEYAHQRPNAEYLIGLARGMGRTVILDKNCAMCRYHLLYGYEDWQAGVHTPIGEMEINKRLDLLNQETAKKTAEMHIFQGRMEEAKHWKFLFEQSRKGGQYHK